MMVAVATPGVPAVGGVVYGVDVAVGAGRTVADVATGVPAVGVVDGLEVAAGAGR